MRKKHRLSGKWAYGFIIVPVILQIIFFYIPTIQGFFYSFTDWTGLTQNFNFIGFANFSRMFSDSKVLTSIGFTAVFTTGLVAGEMVIGILVARLLNSKLKGVGFFRTAFFFPAVLSTVILGLIFKQICNYGLPKLGELIGSELLASNLLANPDTAVYAVMFIALWQGVAIPIVIFLAGLQSVPQDVLEAASIDGATKWQSFSKIELPYLLPSISMVFILALKNGLTAFDLIFSLTAGGPSGKTTSIGLLVYNYAFKSNQFGYANAISAVLFLVIAVISFVQIRLSRKFEVN